MRESCPCQIATCIDDLTPGFHEASIECIKEIRKYCVDDYGWFYDPEPCWPYKARETEIRTVGADGADLYNNTPLLGNRNVMLHIGEGVFEQETEVMVTEITYEELKLGLGSGHPEMYSGSMSDFILIRPVDAEVPANANDAAVITLRIPFDGRLRDGNKPLQLVRLDETHGDNIEWEPVESTMYAFSNPPDGFSTVPSQWSKFFSNYTDRNPSNGGFRFKNTDSPVGKTCESTEFASERGQLVCPELSHPKLADMWADGVVPRGMRRTITTSGSWINTGTATTTPTSKTSTTWRRT